jgi:hypothetical protein
MKINQQLEKLACPSRNNRSCRLLCRQCTKLKTGTTRSLPLDVYPSLKHASWLRRTWTRLIGHGMGVHWPLLATGRCDRPSNGSLLTDTCTGVFVNETKRTAFLIVTLSVIVLLATGCASTGSSVNARLISPISTNQQDANSEGDGAYQPLRSPAFSDLFGS